MNSEGAFDTIFVNVTKASIPTKTEYPTLGRHRMSGKERLQRLPSTGAFAGFAISAVS
jgi:hypothetical protein